MKEKPKAEHFEYCLHYGLPIYETKDGFFVDAKEAEAVLEALHVFVPEDVDISMDEEGLH